LRNESLNKALTKNGRTRVKEITLAKSIRPELTRLNMKHKKIKSAQLEAQQIDLAMDIVEMMLGIAPAKPAKSSRWTPDATRGGG
jgi:hypothetical protein